MNTVLIFFAFFTVAFCRPQDGQVKVTQSSSGTYKYQVNFKDYLRLEQRHDDGTVTGDYIIPGLDGEPQILTYVADKDGFRITKGPLPLSTSLNSEGLLVNNEVSLPSPVEDTPEVKAAKEAFFETYKKALEGSVKSL